MSTLPGDELTGMLPYAASLMECSVGFKMRAGSRLIVEARNRAAAAEVFSLVDRRDKALNGKTAKLAPNLFFAQAEATGNYWIFVKKE